MSIPSAKPCSLRDCRPEEAEALIELWRQAGASASITDSAEHLRRVMAQSPGSVVVAEMGGRLVGSIIGTFDGWRGHIYRLVVAPDYRRRGIARALVAEVNERLARRGARRVIALVEKDKPLATGFWDRVGYRFDPRMVRYTLDL